MDEVLYQFNGEYFICSKIAINNFDTESFSIDATLYGETFDLEKHPQGTEIKAITYSNMQIHDKPQEGRADIYVIVDIWKWNPLKFFYLQYSFFILARFLDPGLRR